MSMSIATADEFLTQYRAISAKLKKRFMRKPNVSEAVEQFNALANDMKLQNSYPYAALCYLAIARCESMANCFTAEAEALVQAARNYFEAEMENARKQSPTFYENCAMATNCYNTAIKIYCKNDQIALAAFLCLELGKGLQKLNKSVEAIGHYQRAVELQHQNPLDVLTSMDYIASCHIETGDFDNALTVLTEMSYLAKERGGIKRGTVSQIPGAYKDILARCEVSRVLILLLLQPTPQRIRPEHANVLERYSWESSDESLQVPYLKEDLFLLLQSLVMAYQANDILAVRELQKDLRLALRMISGNKYAEIDVNNNFIS
ncbi:uncharacterized protein TRIADDRAFT_53007 [Trichoplax adhaerens]|uniref:Factor VIII intron 22 protein n=1 Tax=Trichoplax adhaerens TaxID=10228 RepID=B3RN17_TRIAD|nr:hypothetical protein TRIADDRAFT_53007 [Trichoplax adhaerens]EDV27377.1 hypothetical protein TRIADDRAFT_53007 [Trichoplax adhaerens]|eukprot:XP_002109211.1 hypothetical protein TRIADDRAFT_53007 [Trichoplax adhaerens]